MKFFSRDLLDRCASSDENVASAAEREWEQANECYEKHLRKIESQLPDSIRQMNDLLLHDALVCSIARQGDQLVMVLRKDIPPRDLITLTYTLTSEPVLDREAMPIARRMNLMDFQLDELDVIQDADRTLYQQTILFGNGWEMTLQFSDVRMSAAETIYPVLGVANGAAVQTAIPQSA